MELNLINSILCSYIYYTINQNNNMDCRKIRSFECLPTYINFNIPLTNDNVLDKNVSILIELSINENGIIKYHLISNDYDNILIKFDVYLHMWSIGDTNCESIIATNSTPIPEQPILQEHPLLVPLRIIVLLFECIYYKLDCIYIDDFYQQIKFMILPIQYHKFNQYSYKIQEYIRTLYYCCQIKRTNKLIIPGEIVELFLKFLNPLMFNS